MWKQRNAIALLSKDVRCEKLAWSQHLQAFT